MNKETKKQEDEKLAKFNKELKKLCLSYNYKLFSRLVVTDSAIMAQLSVAEIEVEAEKK